jgi:hypothetical protein
VTPISTPVGCGFGARLVDRDIRLVQNAGDEHVPAGRAHGREIGILHVKGGRHSHRGEGLTQTGLGPGREGRHDQQAGRRGRARGHLVPSTGSQSLELGERRVARFALRQWRQHDPHSQSAVAVGKSERLRAFGFDVREVAVATHHRHVHRHPLAVLEPDGERFGQRLLGIERHAPVALEIHGVDEIEDRIARNLLDQVGDLVVGALGDPVVDAVARARGLQIERLELRTVVAPVRFDELPAQRQPFIGPQRVLDVERDGRLVGQRGERGEQVRVALVQLVLCQIGKRHHRGHLPGGLARCAVVRHRQGGVHRKRRDHKVAVLLACGLLEKREAEPRHRVTQSGVDRYSRIALRGDA